MQPHTHTHTHTHTHKSTEIEDPPDPFTNCGPLTSRQPQKGTRTDNQTERIRTVKGASAARPASLLKDESGGESDEGRGQDGLVVRGVSTSFPDCPGFLPKSLGAVPDGPLSPTCSPSAMRGWIHRPTLVIRGPAK